MPPLPVWPSFLGTPSHSSAMRLREASPPSPPLTVWRREASMIALDPEPRVMCDTALTARGFLPILTERHC